MTRYDELKHRNFMTVYIKLINEAETEQERATVFTVLDYINHLHQRITALEDALDVNKVSLA